MPGVGGWQTGAGGSGCPRGGGWHPAWVRSCWAVTRSRRAPSRGSLLRRLLCAEPEGLGHFGASERHVRGGIRRVGGGLGGMAAEGDVAGVGWEHLNMGGGVQGDPRRRKEDRVGGASVQSSSDKVPAARRGLERSLPAGEMHVAGLALGPPRVSPSSRPVRHGHQHLRGTRGRDPGPPSARAGTKDRGSPLHRRRMGLRRERPHCSRDRDTGAATWPLGRARPRACTAPSTGLTGGQ